MDALERLLTQLNNKREAGYDLIRVFLGIALFVRGVIFISNEKVMMQWTYQQAEFNFLGTAVMHYVALAHLVGGGMLALGLVTRLAAAAQLPILVGAVVLVHWREGLAGPTQSLELAALVLVLLLTFTLFGAGKYSCDKFLRN